jgi:hypothetical protein
MKVGKVERWKVLLEHIEYSHESGEGIEMEGLAGTY